MGVGEYWMAWLVGGGLVTLVLFPLSIPIIALTVVAVLPLLAIPLALAVVAAPVLVLWKLGRWAFRPRTRERTPIADGDGDLVTLGDPR
jgi:hypothetical protein